MYKIIVSLTTTSERIELCRATLMSLATQSILPQEIIINVSSNSYMRDKGIKNNNIISYLICDIPDKVQRIVRCNWVENTGPYRKLMPTLLEADDDDIVVTADDDIFYARNWLKSLLTGFNPEDKIIHAGRVRFKRKNYFGRLSGYVFWPILTNSEILNDDWVITYGGGAVLCRNWFSDELINDLTYLNIAPTADDLWYSKLCHLSNLKVKVVPEVLSQLYFFQHNDGLVNYNFPKSNNWISKVKSHLIYRPLNYFRIVRFGNDKAYDSIERYFTNRS